eukprot:TRINITY_DN6427_c0_g1_i1.p3 TRINITY_DN6427_c0_g1~~TRINITY_DN6427_c0_g1_i1.p3  ORF type:complete len:107 (-),score=13.06 TRINITY_DN6427_c0_g1_i1:98-418(-)
MSVFCLIFRLDRFGRGSIRVVNADESVSGSATSHSGASSMFSFDCKPKAAHLDLIQIESLNSSATSFGCSRTEHSLNALLGLTDPTCPFVVLLLLLDLEGFAAKAS